MQNGKLDVSGRDLNGIILLQQKNVPPDEARIIVYADGSITYKK